MSNAHVTPPPRGLGATGQALLAGGWLLGVPIFFGLDGGVLALIGGLLLLAGAICAGLAWLRAPRFGAAGRVAGWGLLLSPAVALVIFVVVPGDREWGKLWAMVLGAGGAGATSVVAGLAAAIAYLGAARAPDRPWCLVAGIGHLAALGVGLVTFIVGTSSLDRVAHAGFAVGALMLVTAHLAAARIFARLEGPAPTLAGRSEVENAPAG